MKTSHRACLQALSIALLLAGTGAAEAAINPGQPPTGILPGESSSGEFFLSVWDPTALTSYSYDLGLTVDALLADPTTPRTWNLDQRFFDFAGSGNALTFNIAASNGYPALLNDAGGVNANFGFVASHRLGASFNTSPINNASLGQIYSAFTGHIQYLNNAQVAQNPGAVQGDFAANLSEITTSTTAGSYFNKDWGVRQNKIPWNASAVVRSPDAEDLTLDLYFIHANPAAVGAAALIEQIGGGTTPFQFALDANAGTLTWAAQPSVVPLPAADWLLLSGLGSLGWLARRLKKP
ncbi:MAG: VPLPA-CTERM sorting domain-containing protein [Candidatus Methylumidiphilus sp.]